MAENAPFSYPPPAIPGGGAMFRGHMITQAPGSGSTNAVPSGPAMDTIHFQFNPSKIAVAYSGDVTANAVPTGNQTDASGNFFASLTTLSFDVLFDRTQEVRNGALKDGAFHDIRQLQVAYGIFIDPGIASTSFAVGPAMQTYKITTVFFTDVEPLFVYRGRMTGIGVEYQYFTPRMIPLRAAVTFTMSQVLGQGDPSLGQLPGAFTP